MSEMDFEERVHLVAVNEFAKSLPGMTEAEFDDYWLTVDLERGRRHADVIWASPRPIDTVRLTPLPPSSGRHPVALWRFVDAVAEAIQVPRDMVFLLVLSVLSTASGGRWRVRVAPDWAETLALYTVTSMHSGSRKSAAVKAAGAPLYEIERDLVNSMKGTVVEQQALKDRRATEVEHLKKQIGKSKDGATEADLIAAMQALSEIEVPAIPRLLADDVTPEKLGALMHEQGGRMGVISAEGGLFAILAGRYSSGQPNLDLVLKAWSGDPARVDRMNRGALMLDEPFLAIGITIQPEIVEGLSEARLFRGAGLLARFLYCLPESTVGRRDLDPVPIPDAVSIDYKARVQAIARLAWKRETVTEVKLSHAAASELRTFREEIEGRLDPYGGDLAEIVDWASKLPGQLVRIAALLSLFDDPHATEVRGWAMREAVSLAPYLTDQALAAFDTINGRHARSARPRAVLGWLRRSRLTSFTVRDAQRALNGQKWVQDVEAVRDVLGDLADLGWIRLATGAAPVPPQRGRPASARFEVNPAVHA